MVDIKIGDLFEYKFLINYKLYEVVKETEKSWYFILFDGRGSGIKIVQKDDKNFHKYWRKHG